MKQSELAARIVESVTDKSFAEVLAPLEIERQRSADHEFRLAFAASVPGGPVRLLDIGARGGPHQRIAALAAAYDVTLCEPEPDEAARLRQSGYRVIEQVIADLPGARRTFHVTANPCNSSLLRPNPAVVLMYAGGMEKFEVVRDVPVAVTTVDAECERLGLQFEEMKVDVQGAEMLVLKGMTACRPFLIELDVPFQQCEQRVIFALPDPFAGVEFIADLADDYIAGNHMFPAEFLDAQPAARTVATVAG